MNRFFCMGCGAPLAEGTKICPNCGRVIAQPKPQQHSQSRSQSGYRSGNKTVSPQARRSAVPRTSSCSNSRNVSQPRQQFRPQNSYPESGDTAVHKPKLAVRSRKLALLFRIASVTIVVVGIYFAIFFVQVFRVKMSTYDFSSEMKMSKKNYGQAIEGYFEDGSWSVNPFTATCTYKGESKHSEEYEIVFNARLKVTVSEVSVDGEKVDDKLIENKMMGMFI